MKNNCLNLCDLPIDIVSKFLMEDGFEKYYIGSYTCGNYLLYLLKNLSQLSLDRPLNLAIPALSESQFEIAEGMLNNINTKRFCGITVNDLGGLELHKSYFSNIPLYLGRNFFRQYRDVRYHDFYSRETHVFSLSLLELFEEKSLNISGFEIELVSENINIDEIPSQYEVLVHMPYVMATYGHICEFASTEHIIEEKFRPDIECNYQCFKFALCYSTEETTYYKINRAVYFKSSAQIVADREYSRINTDWSFLNEYNGTAFID